MTVVQPWLNGHSIMGRVRSHVHAVWNDCPGSTSGEFAQVAEDIWITDRSIATHMDSTAAGLVTYGLVLLNELHLELLYCGFCFPLDDGDVYRIDGRLPHGAERYRPGHSSPGGLFAALIWDMPKATSLDSFGKEAAARVDEWLSVSISPEPQIQKQ